MISPLRRSDASARAAVARSCVFSLATASCSAADRSAVSAPLDRDCARVSRAAAHEPQHAQTSASRPGRPTMRRQADQRVRGWGDSHRQRYGSGAKRYHAASSAICSPDRAVRLASRSASVMPDADVGAVRAAGRRRIPAPSTASAMYRATPVAARAGRTPVRSSTRPDRTRAAARTDPPTDPRSSGDPIKRSGASRALTRGRLAEQRVQRRRDVGRKAHARQIGRHPRAQRRRARE